MSKKVLFALIGVVSLCLGGLIYVLFRETTYVAQFVNSVVSFEKARILLSVFNNSFVKYYFTDYLWALSLLCLLFSLYLPNIKQSIILCTIMLLTGVVWEILQWKDILTGTGDLLDIVMYLIACISTITINKRGNSK